MIQMKWIGAILIIIACAAVGFTISSNHRREVSSLRKLQNALNFMECELQYRRTALPDLCMITAGECVGNLRKLFENLSLELQAQISPDVQRCMEAAIWKSKPLPQSAVDVLLHLGGGLGRFDIDGQLKALESAQSLCGRSLKKLSEKTEVHLRCYQTLGICAGAALVIILI